MAHLIKKQIRITKKALKNFTQATTKTASLRFFVYDKKLHFETFIIELAAGGKHLSLAHQNKVIEHVIVTEGQIEVLSNKVRHKLKKGEGFHFNADQPHGYRNTSKKKASFHNIIHYPAVGKSA